MRTFERSVHEAVGLDICPSPFTRHIGSIVNRDFVEACLHGVDVVIHSATLHKPHVATHSRQAFVDTNITGTLNLLEAAVAQQVGVFLYTSTTSTFGRALTPHESEPAAWITENVVPVPKNIYGVTKVAAENLCELFHYRSGMPCLVLKTSRFFPEDDDNRFARQAFSDDNLKVNELLHRRADIADIVDAHVLAIDRAPRIGFDRLILSATSPFSRDDLQELRRNAPAVVKRHCPEYAEEYSKRGWTLPPSLDRVYVNERARSVLQWQPRYDFRYAIQCLRDSKDYRSPLARAVGSKGYHAQKFAAGPYPTE
jgi:UDP-glucose 4-epimerase